MHPHSSELLEPKGEGNGNLPEMKLLAMIEKRVPDFRFSPCSLSLEEIWGKDLSFQGFSEIQGKEELQFNEKSRVKCPKPWHYTGSEREPGVGWCSQVSRGPRGLWEVG